MFIFFGFPLILMFLTMSALIFIPYLGIRVTLWLFRRFSNRPPPTVILRQYLDDAADAFPSVDVFAHVHLEQLLAAWDDKLPLSPLFNRFVRTASALYAANGFDPLAPAFPLSPDAIALGRYRDEIIAGLRTATDASRILELLHRTLIASFTELVRKLPPSSLTTRVRLANGDESPPLFRASLVDMVRNPKQLVADLVIPFASPEIAAYKLLRDLRGQLNRNLYEASGQHDPVPAHKLVHPYEHPGTAQEVVKAYLQYTPLQHLFDVEVPFPITSARRMEHWHLIGSSGWGKSQTLQHIIMHDLMEPNPPALIVIDSQGDMLAKIQRLGLFAENPDRLIVIDPEHNPSLNMFDVTTDRRADYSAIVREQVEAGIIELYAYIFGALASELTAKQGTAFTFVVRLMLATPGATLHTLLDLMEDPSKSFAESPFARHAARLDQTARSFFENQFFNKQAFGTTRQQIARRLYAVLSVPAFDRMFSAKRNKLDMFAAIQSRKVVLVNTSKALLKSDASALFGRYMIAQVMAAAFERVAVPHAERNPAYLVIDEAAEYFDESLESLLSQARKFQLGVLFAHQHMEQLTPALRSSVASNTSIKMAGGVSDRDARLLDADMRTSNEFIASMRKGAKSTEFAAYVRNETPTAVRIEVPFGTMEAAPKMSNSAYRRLIERNRAKYSADPVEPVVVEHEEVVGTSQTGSPPRAEEDDPRLRKIGRS